MCICYLFQAVEIVSIHPPLVCCLVCFLLLSLPALDFYLQLGTGLMEIGTDYTLVMYLQCSILWEIVIYLPT